MCEFLDHFVPYLLLLTSLSAVKFRSGYVEDVTLVFFKQFDHSGATKLPRTCNFLSLLSFHSFKNQLEHNFRHCASRALSENSASDDVILHATMF